jgi:hypothetical protein
MVEEKLQALLQEGLAVANKTKAIKPTDLNRMIVDTSVQPKNVMFPTDTRLLSRAREILVRLAPRHGVNMRPRLTPPSLGRSIAWLADQRRDPTPINSHAKELSLGGYAVPARLYPLDGR